MPPLSGQLSEKGKPWPGYFLVRTTGDVVPLIAVDELPPDTELDGVPRSLNLEDTIGMLNLGLRQGCGYFYQITRQEEKSKTSFDSPSQVNTSDKTHPQVNLAQVSEASRFPPSNTLHTPPATPPTGPQGRGRLPPPRAETQTCRHWCAHGICKWGQQCRYRHIMPMSLPGLQEVGLNDWPTWYRALNPGYFAGESMSANLQRPSSGRKARARACAGNGCCGVADGSGRVRGPGHGPGRKGKEEMGLGEQILERLRNMSKEGKRGLAKVAEEKESSNNVLAERATVKETRAWEDESEDSEVGEKQQIEGKNGKPSKEKLVDV